MEQTPSPQATSVSPAAQPLQAIVDYLPGITIAGAKPSLLEWGLDDHIRLFEMDFDTKQAKSVIFDATIGTITKVTGSMVMLTFHTGGNKYNVQFSQTAAGKMGLGAVGLAFAYQETKNSGINAWTNRLKASGVETKVMGWSWSIKWGLILAGIIFVGAVIYAVMMTNA